MIPRSVFQNHILFFLACIFFASCQEQESTKALFENVNPFIGTGGHGHTYPGATLPFGMVQLSPDTRLDGWDGCGGYHYSDSVIYGFSHTHLQGTGVSDYGDILMMPCTQFKPGANKWSDRYSSRFSHENEIAHAGFYSVYLDDHQIQVDLTATERVGIHRYQLDEPDTLTVIFDLQHRDKLIHYSIYPLDDSTLVGHRVSDNWAREQHVYFAARFDHAFEWRDQLSEITITDTLEDGTTLQTLEYVPVFACDFGVVDELNAHVGLSFVDIDGALNNLEKEAPAKLFEDFKADAESTWEEQLGCIEIEGGSEDERTTFYSALYHSMTTPNIASDVDLRYRGTDLKIHQLTDEEEAHYTIFSLWDTFRSLHPLLNWIEPKRSKDFIRTMLRMYQEGGQLPVWELAGNYTGCMIGYHSVPVIQDAITWGIEGFDQPLALEAMLQAADSSHLGLPSFQKFGFIPLDKEHESVSKTLEYAFDDACIAAFASHLEDSYAPAKAAKSRFTNRSLFYRNLYNEKSGFIQPKRGGAWLEAFEPREVNFNYTEANGWQYNFFTPHDVNGHIDLMGGDQAYLQKLEEMFTSDSETTGRQQPDITGMIGQYAHGNEPSHHMAFLYPYVGNTSRTAELVRSIQKDLYANQPDGLSGNEDCGQMSAWYVWSALGLYPVCPGSDQVVSGIPLFDAIHIHPRKDTGVDRASLLISRTNNQPFVSGWSVNGQNRSESWISKTILVQGGQLAFECQNEPSTFGQSKEDRPTQKMNDSTFVPVPVIHAPRTFQSEQTVVSISTMRSDAHVQYRLCSISGAPCRTPWIRYDQPFLINEDSRIEAYSETTHELKSPIVSHSVREINHHHVLTLNSAFDPQYAAGGGQALIDGIQGNNHYQTGDWQGFWGTDVIATVDLGERKQVQSLSIGALRDIRPWIFLPKSVSFYNSHDNVHWNLLETISHNHSNTEESAISHRFVTHETSPARYWRAEVNHYGSLPEWHLGAGNPSWLFMDEFDIETQE